MNLLTRLNTLLCSLWQRPKEEVCLHLRTSRAHFIETAWHDIRFALRTLRNNPGFAAITALTLALGVAGNILIFTVYNSLYLRLFPFVEPSQLVDLDETAPRWNLEYTGLSYPDFDGWRQQNRSFESMAAWCFDAYNVSFEGAAERVTGARVTHELGSVLKIQPVLGRMFAAEEDQVGGAKVMLLANGFWKRRFGGREDILGQTVRANHESYTIVGVLPPDKNVLVDGEFWVPLAYDTRAQQGWHLRGLGRLKEGVTLENARQDLSLVHRGLVASKLGNENTAPRLTPLGDRFFGGMRALIRVLLGAVVVVLLIACSNVAALMLARGLARSRELGLRLSLGATRLRLASLIGAESLILAGVGGLGGVALGRWGLHTMLNSLPEQPPRWVSFDMDWRVWLCAGLMVTASALLGALPVIWSASKLDLHVIAQSSAQQSTTTAGGRRSLNALVVAEVALTLVVMVQAGLLLRTFRSLQKIDPGYNPDHVLVYQIALPGVKYGSSEARTGFFQDHLDRVRALPGVVSASAINAPPLGGHWGNFFNIENAAPKGPNEPDPVVLQRIAFPRYFETMAIPMVAGRSFIGQDGINDGSRSVIVNENFAKRFWPGENPIGKRISHRYPNGPWMTVVGVARDVRHYGQDQPVKPGVYIPFVQDPQCQMAVVVRSSVEPFSLVASVRSLVRQSDQELPLFGVVTMEQRLAQSMWPRRLTASLFEIFSGVALLMAVGGIYGVFSYVVSRRTQEIGVRMALGAHGRDVLWLVVRNGLALAGVGVGIGLLGTLLIVPGTRNLLYDVSPFDPIILAGVALLLMSVAAFACWLPARRAMNVQPMTALRCE